MSLPVFFVILIILLLIILSQSFRVSVEFIAIDNSINYTITGSILKIIKVFELKSGVDKERKKDITREKKSGKMREGILKIIGRAVKNKKGKIFHIEKLSLKGTFSIEDAAANAILHGVFMILWQFLLIFLASNFRLEHQHYNLLPDFEHDRNKMIFQAILRVVILNMVLFSIHSFFESKNKKF